MGLLLSVLVSCVGVIELLTFYHNVKRRVRYQSVETSPDSVRSQYLKELESVRNRLELKLQLLKTEANVVSTHSNIPTFRLNSHEDIEVEFNDKAVARSRSPSPRRFLVSEKQTYRNSPTRQFVVSEELQALQGIQKSQAQECLPEYLIEEQQSSGIPRYVLKDDNGPVPIPLPEKFLVSEREKEVKADVFRKKLGHNIVEVDGETYYRRSPSPFPSFDLTAPRNSVCSELLDDSVSVAEVDEFSRSNSHSPIDAEEICASNNLSEKNDSEKVSVLLESSSHSSTEYWNNKVLVVPSRKSKSRSPSPGVFKKQKDGKKLRENVQRRRSKSESNSIDFMSNLQPITKTTSSLDFSEERRDYLASDSEEELVKVQMYSEEMKNSLDGIDRSKECAKKKFIKRKRIKNKPATAYKSDSTKKHLSFVIKESKSDERAPNDEATSSENVGNISSKQSGKPFWVNC